MIYRILYLDNNHITASNLITLITVACIICCPVASNLVRSVSSLTIVTNSTITNPVSFGQSKTSRGSHQSLKCFERSYSFLETINITSFLIWFKVDLFVISQPFTFSRSWFRFYSILRTSLLANDRSVSPAYIRVECS